MDSNQYVFEEREIASLAVHRVDDIILMNTRLQEFWQGYGNGWCSTTGAELLREAKLDWQIELSHTLKLFLSPGTSDDQQARLILAWANLGTLVEGTMKWFLCVFHGDYSRNPLLDRSLNPIDPPEIWFAKLCEFFEQNIWTSPRDPKHQSKWWNWTRLVRQRRNAIHAFCDHDIGTHSDWLKEVCNYWQFLSYMNSHVPYPDEPPAAPEELNYSEFWDRRDDNRGIPLPSYRDLHPLL